MRLFGRTLELERLQQAFAGGARLITVLGPGGIGKTSLARSMASGSEHLFVDLTTVRSSSILSTVARALDLRPGTSRPRTIRRVQERLAQYRLLVLDNAEVLLDEAAELAPALSSSVPLLVTSRESLRIGEETVIELGPLEGSSREDMLLDRTVRARAGATPGEEERQTIVEIAAALEGIPLALELAGSRLGVMSATTFASKLHRRLDLLVSSRRGDPRHRTMRAVLDASHDLLGPEQQRALASLAVFSGGFEIEEAEAVLSSLTDATSAVDDLLQKSWLMRAGAVRFDMYQTIKSYAAEHLAELGLTEIALRSHAECFASLAERAPHRIASERDNLLAVVEAESIDPSLRARVLLAMEELLVASESSATLVALADRVLAHASRIEQHLAARLHLAAARAKDRSGDGRAAKRDLLAARRLARKNALDLRFEIATFSVTFSYMHGEHLLPVRRGLRALALAGDRVAPRIRSQLLTEVGVALHMAGDRTGADARYQEALAIADASGDRDAQGRVLACIGFLRQDLGALAEADDAYRRALAIMEDLGRRDVRGIILGYLGNLERRRGRSAIAERYYDRALEDLRRIGDRQFEPLVLMDRALLLLDQARWSEAEGLLLEAIGSLESMDSPDMEAMVKGALAVVEAKNGRIDGARVLIREALERMPAEGPRRPMIELCRAAVDLEADERSIASARKCVEDARAMAESDDYVRLASQLVERAIAKHAASGDGVLFERTGAWFEAPGFERAILEKREPLRRILTVLVRERFESPDCALGMEDLFRAGWPDEKIIESAAKNRVRVAVATLRSLGLRDVLLTRGSSYLLDPQAKALIV